MQVKPYGRALLSGFTFLEVLMAVSILSILLVGVHKLESQMVSMNQATRFISLAPLLAQRQMSEMERRNFKDIQDDSGEFGSAYPGYVWSWRVEYTDSDILEKLACPMKKIDIFVSYNRGERTYSLRSYRVDKGKSVFETHDKLFGSGHDQL